MRRFDMLQKMAIGAAAGLAGATLIRKFLSPQAASAPHATGHLGSCFLGYEDADIFAAELGAKGYMPVSKTAEELDEHEYLRFGKESPENWRDGGEMFVWRES